MSHAKTSELRTPGASHLPGERRSWEAVVQAGGNWLHEDQGAWQRQGWSGRAAEYLSQVAMSAVAAAAR